MIAVEANLHAESDGLHFRVSGTGNVLTCRLDGRPLQLFRTLRKSGPLLGAIRAAVPALIRIGLRVDVFAGNVRVASAGSGVKQNVPARYLKLPGVRLGS